MLHNILKELWKEKSIKVIMLTGTPITDSTEDFYESMELLGVKKGDEEKYVSYLKSSFCEIDYMGSDIDGFGWRVETVPLPEDFVSPYKMSVETSGGESFYTKAIQVVLSSHVKQDLAIARVTQAMKKDDGSRFFIYCNRLGKDGIDYISEEIDRITGKKPCIITSRIGRSLTVDDINKARVIVGSLASNEGISINGLKQVHIITPHWNISQTRQAIGRGTRFKVGEKSLPIEVYCYAAYHEKVEPDPMYSIDLYEYKKSFDKDRASRQLLDKFTSLLPSGGKDQVEPQVVDMFEDLMYYGELGIAGSSKEKLESLQ
ncbi:hypothetical protein GGI04_001538 [Coemansia thaxteri]|nr:hypothetical protein GGI04_001538 [Coemansia thaxteri]